MYPTVEELELLREAVEAFQAGLQEARESTIADRSLDTPDALNDLMAEYDRRKRVGDSIEAKIQEAFNAAG